MLSSIRNPVFVSLLACTALSCSDEQTAPTTPFGLDLQSLTQTNAREVAAVNEANVTVSITINSESIASWKVTENRSTVTLQLDKYLNNTNNLVVSWSEAIGDNIILLEEYTGNFTVTPTGGSVTPVGSRITTDGSGRFDADGDGLSNLSERENNTDPTTSDSNNGNDTTVDNGSNNGSDNEDNGDLPAPEIPVLSLQYLAPKTHRLNWATTSNTSYYKVLENKTGSSGFEQIGSDLQASISQLDHRVPLHKRVSAQYLLQACNADSCTDSQVIAVSGDQRDAVGFFKPSNTQTDSKFGTSVALSDDGNTMAAGAPLAGEAGTIYVFFNNGNNWTQQARLETESGDTSNFGKHLALSGDGNTLASSDTIEGTGIVSIFIRNANVWVLQKRLLASNPDALDLFGVSYSGFASNPLSLNYDGSLLAVGASGEQSNASGLNGDQSNNSSQQSGAVYLFNRSGSQWIQATYLKASNSEPLARFGRSVSLSNDGSRLAVGASGTGDPSRQGTTYVYHKSGSIWTEHSILKSTRNGEYDEFGELVVLSGDGQHLAVVAQDYGAESSSAAGEVHLYSISGNQWQLVNILDPSDELDEFQIFGSSVAWSNDGQWLAIGELGENSNANGLDGNISNNSSTDAGAVFLYKKAGSQWLFDTYIKSSNTEPNDFFGRSVSMSGNGDTIAVGASQEDSSGTGLSANQNNNSSSSSGAIYLY